MLMGRRLDRQINRDWQAPECADDVAEKYEDGLCYNIGKLDGNEQHLDRRSARRDDFYRTGHTEC